MDVRVRGASNEERARRVAASAAQSKRHQAAVFDAIAAKVEEQHARLEALKAEKTPQSGWALLNPATAVKTLAGHYDNLEVIHQENLARLDQIRHGAKMAAIVMRKHDLTLAELEALDVKALTELIGTHNAIAIRDCLAQAHRGVPTIDASYLDTELDTIGQFIGDQLRSARAHDEILARSDSRFERAVGKTSATILDNVSALNAGVKDAVRTAREYWNEPARKDTWTGCVGRGATFAGDVLASAGTMPLTVADVKASDDDRANALAGTLLMAGTAGMLKAGGPAWTSFGNGVRVGAGAVASTRPIVWIAESGGARFVTRTADALGELGARFEATAFAKSAERVKESLAKVNALGSRKALTEAPLDPIPPHGRRNTLGRSGDPTPAPAAHEPHLAAIDRGLSRMPPQVRSHLEFLLDGAEAGRVIRAEMAMLDDEMRAVATAQANAQKAFARGEARAVGELEELSRKMRELVTKHENAAARLKAAQRAAEPRAADVMDYFLRSVRRSSADAKRLAERVPIDRDALEAVAKSINRTPKEAEARLRSWLTEFFECADPRVRPKEMRLFFDPKKRAHYEHGKGINVGKSFDKKTLFHEGTHPIEHVDSAASAATKAWRDARAAAVDSSLRTKSLRELNPPVNYASDEVAYAVHDFVDDYVGKLYSKGPATEVLSMFGQELSSSADAAKLFARDPEHFFLGLGLIW